MNMDSDDSLVVDLDSESDDALGEDDSSLIYEDKDSDIDADITEDFAMVLDGGPVMENTSMTVVAQQHRAAASTTTCITPRLSAKYLSKVAETRVKISMAIKALDLEKMREIQSTAHRNNLQGASFSPISLSQSYEALSSVVTLVEEKGALEVQNSQLSQSLQLSEKRVSDIDQRLEKIQQEYAVLEESYNQKLSKLLVAEKQLQKYNKKYQELELQRKKEHHRSKQNNQIHSTKIFFQQAAQKLVLEVVNSAILRAAARNVKEARYISTLNEIEILKERLIVSENLMKACNREKDVMLKSKEEHARRAEKLNSALQGAREKSNVLQTKVDSMEKELINYRRKNAKKQDRVLTEKGAQLETSVNNDSQSHIHSEAEHWKSLAIQLEQEIERLRYEKQADAAEIVHRMRKGSPSNSKKKAGTITPGNAPSSPTATIIIHAHGSQAISSPGEVPPPPPNLDSGLSRKEGDVPSFPSLAAQKQTQMNAIDECISALRQQLQHEKSSKIKAIRSQKEALSRSRLLDEEVQKLKQELDRMKTMDKARPGLHQADANERIRASEVAQALRQVSIVRNKLRASQRAKENAERVAHEKEMKCEELQRLVKHLRATQGDRRQRAIKSKEHEKSRRGIQDENITKELGLAVPKDIADERSTNRYRKKAPAIDSQGRTNFFSQDYDIHGRKSKALVDTIEWDDRVAQARKIIEGVHDISPAILPAKNGNDLKGLRKPKKNDQHSLTLPSLRPQREKSKQSRSTTPRISDDDTIVEDNHEQRLEKAYERLRNRQMERHKYKINSSLAKTF